MSHFSCLVIHEEDEDIDELLVPWMENCFAMPPFEYLEFFECDECDVDEATGKRGYWQNPDARWDWFEVGGRFSNVMPLKGGGTTIEAPLGEIEFGSIPSRHEEELVFWRKAVEGILEPGENPPFCWPPASDLRRKFANAEDYATAHDRFVPWAVVIDGEWYEQGEMGWWCISNDPDEAERKWCLEFYDRFIKDLDPSLLGTIVDCHI